MPTLQPVSVTFQTAPEPDGAPMAHPVALPVRTMSPAVSPLIGRMMDRFGPRGVMELGVALGPDPSFAGQSSPRLFVACLSDVAADR